MRKIPLALFLTLVFALFSCNRIESKIKKIDTELTLAEQSIDKIDGSQLELLEAQLNALQSDMEANRSDYTDKQFEEIGKLQGRYSALALKKGIDDVSEGIKKVGNQLEGFIEGINK